MVPPRRLVFTRDADKFLEALAPKQYKQIVGKILDLTDNPTPHDSRDLLGYNGRRMDSGEFRIVYRYDEDHVYIDVVGKQNDDEVYRQMRRR